MIDPRSMPCARVCLSRLSPTELPPNALEQYHTYAAKRKSSDSTLCEATVTNATGMSVQHSPVHFSFVSGVSEGQDTCVNSPSESENTSVSSMTIHGLPVDYLYVPAVDSNQEIDLNVLNVTKETIGTGMYADPPVNYSFVQGGNEHVFSGFNALVNAKDTVAVPVSGTPANYSCLGTDEVDTIEPVNMRPSRRNSVVSITSSHSSCISKGKELIASVRLCPVPWDSPRCLSRQLVNCKPGKRGTECIDKTVADDSTSSGTKCASNLSYFMTAFKPQDFSNEDVVSISSTSSTAEVSEPSTLSDESTPSADQVIRDCKDVWHDFRSYSPPESPVHSAESVVSKELEILPMETDNVFHAETDTYKMDVTEPSKKSQPLGDEKADDHVGWKSQVRHLSWQQKELYSPEIKLVSVDRKYSERRLSHSNVSPPKRKSLSPKGDLVVKLDDVGNKLTPCRSGGLTIVSGRYTTSGRRILSNYNEKSLAETASKGMIPTEVKKRRGRNKVGKDSGRKKKRGRPRNPAGRKKINALLRYENLKFKDLNTIPRISTRYKVAFTKWPYVFTGALDLINQRLTNQNAFWNSIRS